MRRDGRQAVGLDRSCRDGLGVESEVPNVDDPVKANAGEALCKVSASKRPLTLLQNPTGTHLPETSVLPPSWSRTSDTQLS